MKIWGRIIKNNKTIAETVADINNPELTRTKTVFAALEQICDSLDLAQPIWLESNISDFKRRSRTRFTSDSFIEPIEFDYLDFYVIEED